MTNPDFRQKRYHVPIAREGLPFIGIGVFVTVITALLGHELLTWLFLIGTLLVGHFFRDPIRWSHAGTDEVISPADGKVIAIEEGVEEQFTRRSCRKISIFMSVFDVHVNRAPISGTVKGIHYRKGRFWSANLDKAGRENEQNRLWIARDDGRQVVVTQVAGLIARRIVCWPAVGDALIQGERFGMIRFGSRLDVYVLGECSMKVAVGERVSAGESILCRLK